ncbi:MAG: aldolase [Rhodobacterales bacterium CG18_big_fil_WC_8_21_14_2_50_71_9]|nr:MAG: aldolase [Rhodobacterales bacterium CG18_big_fil_WC_8_21_14_2_50_71_9]PJA59608.1 MAG: DUF1476 domain-containing protein [Rhodobacterales bacterium CG_4_9_14_3_um_filter_71_31]
MTTFNDREAAFEKKFAHDAEMQFKVEARRNKALGIWAAGLLGKTGDAAEAYALEVMMADLKEAGDADVLRKVLADLKAASVEMDEKTLRDRMNAFLAQTKAQVLEESGD